MNHFDLIIRIQFVLHLKVGNMLDARLRRSLSRCPFALSLAPHSVIVTFGSLFHCLDSFGSPLRREAQAKEKTRQVAGGERALNSPHRDYFFRSRSIDNLAYSFIGLSPNVLIACKCPIWRCPFASNGQLRLHRAPESALPLPLAVGDRAAALRAKSKAFRSSGSEITEGHDTLAQFSG